MNYHLLDALGRYWSKLGYSAFREWVDNNPEQMLDICGVTLKF